MIPSYAGCINYSHFSAGELVELFEMKNAPGNSAIANASVASHRQEIAVGDIGEEYKEFFTQARFITGLIIYPILCVFGLCGNGLSILVLSLKKMRTPTNIYLISLAVSDSIKLINDLLYFVSIMCLEFNPLLGRTIYATLYPYAHYFFNMSVCCTAWLTVSVALERYILVCHPTRALTMCNFAWARFLCIFVFVSTSILTIPLAFRYKTIKVYNFCEKAELLEVTVHPLWRNQAFAITYTWIHNSLRTIIPILVVSALNYFIVHSLRESRRRHPNRSSLHRITLMLVSVIVVFVLCVTPDAIISTVFRKGYYEANYLVRGIREITDCLLLVNSATNFILYCIFNSVFRQNFIAMFCATEGEKAYLFKRDITVPYTSTATFHPHGNRRNTSNSQLVFCQEHENDFERNNVRVEIVDNKLDTNHVPVKEDTLMVNGKGQTSL